MLFYADKQRSLDVHEVRDRVSRELADIADLYRHHTRSPRSAALKTHANLVGAAIAFGELHQAVSDHLNPEVDDALPETDQLAAAGIAIGRCLYRSSQLVLEDRRSASAALRASSLTKLLQEASKAVAGSLLAGLPATLQARVPEGYAFYCLYPETYIASLRKALSRLSRRDSYVVVGIRSIGTSLATIVAGALLELGCTARVETVRPRGHPFNRFILLAPTLRDRLTKEASSGAEFIVVDEGPGLTCSSFLSVCSALSELGVAENRLTILCAWRGSPSIYATDSGRARWQRLRAFSSEAAEAFERWQAFVPFILQAAGMRALRRQRKRPEPSPEIRDLSYGRWREPCYRSQSDWPTIHRATERAKVLYRFRAASSLPVSASTSNGDRGDSSTPFLAKFVGLGDYGQQKYERAKALASAGFSPPVVGLAYGFLVYRFLSGATPMAISDLSAPFVARMVHYYSFIARTFSVPPAPRFELLAEAILTNSREALGIDTSEFVAAWRSRKDEIDRLPLTLLDGRPQPHEWLKVAGEDGEIYLKTDSSDHFCDHTLVGEQSILWDLAGACEEWEMSNEQKLQMLDLWRKETGDCRAADLLDFYRAAYLALRIAGLHYAIHSTDEDDVRQSLQDEQHRFGCRLAGVIAGRQPSTDG